MFFLVTGASGVGKSTVRQLLATEFAGTVDMMELAALGVTPQWDLAWRHQMVERVVCRALDAQQQGRAFLFCGDPVPPGEVLAAPSADRLGPISVCLLDASPEAQEARLTARGDDPALTVRHVAFAAWMRQHVTDPTYRPDVITGGGWSAMRWDRWVGRTDPTPPWSATVIDTTGLAPTDTAQRVASWLRAGLQGRPHAESVRV